MADAPDPRRQREQQKHEKHGADLQRQIGVKERRRLRSQQEKDRSIWFGLGTFGMVGWSVAIPAVIGIAVGIWIDSNYPSSVSWTLMFVFIGIALGCLNAWYWISKERRVIERRAEKPEDE